MNRNISVDCSLANLRFLLQAAKKITQLEVGGVPLKLFGNLIGIPRVSGVLGPGGEPGVTERIAYPVWCQGAWGSRGGAEGDEVGVGRERGEKPPSRPEHMQVVEKPSNGKIPVGKSF